MIFILEFPDDTSFEKDIKSKPIERKFSFNDEEILKLIEWECQYRLCAKLKTSGRFIDGKDLSTRFVPISSVRVECVEKALKFLKETYQVESIQDQAEPNTFYIKKQNKQTINQQEKMDSKETKSKRGKFNNIYKIAKEIGISVYENNDKVGGDTPKLKVIQLSGKKPIIRFVHGSEEEKKIYAEKLFEALQKAKIPCSLSNKGNSMVLDDIVTVEPEVVAKRTYTKSAKKVDLSSLGESLKVFVDMLSQEQKDFLIPQKPVPVSEINPTTILDTISQNFYFVSRKNKAAKLFEATPGFFETNESILKFLKKIKTKK